MCRLRSDRNLALRIMLPTEIGRATLRRGQVADTWVHLEANTIYDVAAQLRLPEADARQLVSRSPDVQRYRLAGYLKVLDEPPAPIEVESFVAPAPSAPPAPIDVPTLTPVPASTRPLSATIPLVDVDVTPSMRWSRDKLEALARSRGLRVAPNATKKALLKLLRG